MKNGRYILALALLTLFLFGSSRWVPTKEVEPHEQSQTAQAAEQRLSKNSPVLTAAAPSKPMPKLAPRLVTLYPSGSISVIKTKTVKKTRPKPKRKAMAPPKNLLKVRPTQKPAAKAPAVSERRNAEHTVVPASSKLRGRRPVLEVGYEQIGFNHYVEVMERVGRLYVLVKEGQDVQLGPEVSLARTELLGDRGIDKANYAIERPHLISDDFIEDSLSLLRLPEAALKDRVVLVFNAPFDRLLWQVIGKIIADQNLRIEDILKVSADYVLENRTIYLKFSSAIAKRNSQLLSLKRKIPVVML